MFVLRLKCRQGLQIKVAPIDSYGRRGGRRDSRVTASFACGDNRFQRSLPVSLKIPNLLLCTNASARCRFEVGEIRSKIVKAGAGCSIYQCTTSGIYDGDCDANRLYVHKTYAYRPRKAWV